jgi:hypothetical protein
VKYGVVLPTPLPSLPSAITLEGGSKPRPPEEFEISHGGEKDVIHDNMKGHLSYEPPLDSKSMVPSTEIFDSRIIYRVNGKVIDYGGGLCALVPKQSVDWYGRSVTIGYEAKNVAGWSVGVMHYWDGRQYQEVFLLGGDGSFASVILWDLPSDWSVDYVRTLLNPVGRREPTRVDYKDYSLAAAQQEFEDLILKLPIEVMDSLDADVPLLDIYGELANTCVGSQKMISSNLPSTAYETATLLTGVMDTIEASTKVASKKSLAGKIQALADLRLCLKWGVPLTLQDVNSIAKTVSSKDFTEYFYNQCLSHQRVTHASMTRPRTARAPFSGATAETRYTLKCIVQDSRVAFEQRAARLAADLNVVSLQNGWDMVPYSFVVDWFTDFSSVLEAADNVNYRVAFWDVIGSVKGQRTVVKIPSSAIMARYPRFSGNIELVSYRRNWSSTIPLPTLGFLSPSIGTTQWLDGATLVGQFIGHK